MMYIDSKKIRLNEGSMEKKVYVGSYTGPEKGKGIYYCLLDTETGALRRISVEEQCENPNFIAVNWKKKNSLCVK